MVLKFGKQLLDIIQKSPKLAEELFDMMQKLRRSAFFDPTTQVEKPWLYAENVKTSEGIKSIWKARNVDEVVKEKLPFLVEHRGIGAVKIPTKGDRAWKEGKMGDYVYYKNKELNEIIQDEDLMGRIMVDPRLKVLLNKEINDFLKRGRELAPYYTFPGSAMSKDPTWARAFARFDMDTKATEYDNFKSTLEMIHTQLGGYHVRFVERALLSKLNKMDRTEMEYKPHPAIKHLFPKAEAKVIKLETKGKKSGTLTEKRNKAYEDLMKTGPKKNGDFASGGGVGTLFEARV